MGFLDRLLGRPERDQYAQQPSADQAALDRYRYLVRTAPPERVEAVHAEAFARLTPEQRRMVFDEMSRTAPAGEAPRADDPRSLAQSATRSEFRQPGYMERTLGGMHAGGGSYGARGGMGFGGMLGASLLGSVAGYVIGSTLMSAFAPDPSFTDGGVDAAGDPGAESAASDGGSDWGGDFGGSDWGGGFGDFDV
jgi:hypothetical protein